MQTPREGARGTNILPWRTKTGKQVVRAGQPSWRLRWERRDPATGGREYVYETFHGSRREAERRWIDRDAEIRAEGAGYVRPSRATLAQYLDTWLERRRADLRPSTVDSYGQMVRTHIAPALGGARLSDLTAPAVESWVADMLAGRGATGCAVGARTAAYARTVLRIALQDAVRLGLLRDNPVARTRGPKQAPRHVSAFTLQQAVALFERASSTRLRPLLEFAFFTGLRRGELLALKWTDVDWDGRTVRVSRSRVKAGGSRRGIEQEPKTSAGRRTVALPDAAVEALRRQQEAQARDRAAAGERYADRGYVFATALGNPLGPDDVSRDFRRLRDRAPCPECGRYASPRRAASGGGEPRYRCRHCRCTWAGGALPRLPFHALRHSAASIQIASGIPLEVVSKRLGHRRFSTTMDTYAHLLPEVNAAAAAQVDEFVRRVLGGRQPPPAGSGGTPGSPPPGGGVGEGALGVVWGRVEPTESRKP
jgi:integrase